MRVNSIQVLRAVAAILVVYEHSMDLQISFSKSVQQSFFHLNNFGCIGVDLFFVISGFIITFVASKYLGLKQGLNFLQKRFLRINPIYYLVTIIVLGIQFADSRLNHSFLKPSSIINSLSDSILIVPISGDISVFSPLLIVGWTLSFEWIFYILFFSIIAFKKRYELFMPTIIISLVLLGYCLEPYDFRLVFITNPIMLEFLLGIVICWFYFKLKAIPKYLGSICLMTGLTLYIFMIFYGFGNVWHYKGVLNANFSFERFVIWGIPSALIVAGSVFLETKSKLNVVWNNRWALLIGNASYSIYLIHGPVLILLSVLYKQAGFFLPADISIFIHLVVSVLVGALFFKTIENPLLETIKKASKEYSVTPIKTTTVTKSI